VHRHPASKITIICLALCILATGGWCRGKTSREGLESAEVRQPVVAGACYPDDAGLLVDQIDHFLANVPPQEKYPRFTGLVVPHAGYVFSGQVAAYSYDLLRGKRYHTVLLIGSSHRARYPGASVYHGTAYETPLGRVSVNREMADRLIASAEVFSYVPQAHQAEHSLEVQLPFLQRILDQDFSFVPILIGPECSFEQLEIMAREISRAVDMDDGILLVASTDLSHYPSYQEACRVDRETLKVLEQFDPRALAEHEPRWLQKGIPGLHCAMCGDEAVMVTMIATRAQGANRVKVLHYANSGDVPIGDRQKVVGYCAAVFYQDGSEEEGGVLEVEEELGHEEQAELLEIARQAIAERLAGERYMAAESSQPRLMQKRGAFVTLHKNGRLRGCIGRFLPDGPLCRTVADMAQAAAFEDRRFSPLSSTELAEVEIEISVLSPLREVASIDEIELGKHGIWITRDNTSGCYLPQVADQTGWSKQEFLEHCCRDKALLPEDAYLQEGTKIYVFTAQIFHEH